MKKVKTQKNTPPGLKKKARSLHNKGLARAPRVKLPSPETKKVLKP